MMGILRSFARVAAGPFALVAFFLPWVHGEGILRYEFYSGFDLVRLATALEQLDLTPSQDIALFVAKSLLLAIPVAAVWRTILAPSHSRHWGFRVAGVYMVIAGLGLAALGLIRTGGVVPSPGLALMLCSSLMILVPNVRSGLRLIDGRLPWGHALSANREAKTLSPNGARPGSMST